MTQRRFTSLFSDSWHSVGPLRPTILGHIQVSLHSYRAEPWYVLYDSGRGKSHRVGLSAYRLIEQFDGNVTIDDAWQKLAKESPELMPSQTEVVELISQLHAQDLVQMDIPPNAEELFERYEKEKRQTWMQWIINPLSPKIPLLNPDPWLAPASRTLSWLWTWQMMMVWSLVVAIGGILALQHWRPLTENIGDKVLAGPNLLAMILIYPVLKTLHEIGHGLATRTWGGRVTQAGVMLLMLAPSPYVDASSASAFTSKWRRVIVGAAGMMVELFIAAIAMMLWTFLEPGVLRSLMLNIMLVAGISTVIINANPLLRFDGYFMLCDAIEMPNLGQRGQRLLTAWTDRYLFGAKDVAPTEQKATDRWFLAIYTVLSWVYRITVTLSIVVFIGSKYFVVGLILAAWSLVGLLITPAYKSIKHVWTSPQLLKTRGRAKFMFLSILGLSIAVGGFLQLPLRTQAQGVIAASEAATLRNLAAGEFSQWQVPAGSELQKGQIVATLTDPTLAAELLVSKAKVAEAQARYNAERVSQTSQAGVLKSQLTQETVQLERLKDKSSRLKIVAQTSGTLLVEKHQDYPGRYLRQGEALGYVLNDKNLLIRLVIDQDNEELAQVARIEKVSVRAAHRVAAISPTQITRVTPGGTQDLPSAALSQDGGGQIAVDPREKEGLKSLQRLFIMELEVPSSIASDVRIGERIYVRFEHFSEPLFVQTYRRIRQSFLTYFAT